MPQKAQLEIYKIKLYNKNTSENVSFREFCRYKLDLYDPHRKIPLTIEDIFNKFRQYFIEQLDGDGYYEDLIRKKGYVIANKVNEEGAQSSHISAYSERLAIVGVLDGGSYGKRKSLGVIENKEDVTPINPNNIVCDKFLFLIHTPLDHHEVLVMIQSYSDSKISDSFRGHLKEIFTYHPDIKSVVEMYLPPSLENQLLNDSVFSSVSYSTDWIVNSNDFDDAIRSEFDLRVKVEIQDRNGQEFSNSTIRSLIDRFGNAILSLGSNNNSSSKRLEEFSKTSAKIKSSTGRPLTIKLDRDNKIRPVIYLNEHGIEPDEDSGEFDFDNIEEFCLDLLDRVKDEFLPGYGIHDI